MIDVPLQQLGITIPEDVREPFEKPPQGIIEWEVKELRARMTEPQDGQGISRLVLEAELVATAPDQAAGIEFRESFWIGTDTDPQAQSPETWRTEAGRLVKFCDMAGFNARGATVVQIAGWLSGRKIASDCQHFLVNAVMANGQPNPKAFTQTGEQKSKARMRWMEQGSATPCLYEDQSPRGGRVASGSTSNGTSAPAAPPVYPSAPVIPQAPQAPVYVAPPQMPRPAAPVAPVAHAAVAPPAGFPSTVPPAAPPAPRRR